MPEKLSGDQIALLCDIAERDPSRIAPKHRRDLERLVSEGYVQPDADGAGPGLKLTAKGVEFLGERGAGLNEG